MRFKLINLYFGTIRTTQICNGVMIDDDDYYKTSSYTLLKHVRKND